MDRSDDPKINAKLQVQLQSFKTKIGANPNLEDNGRFLHLHAPIGGFNEWTVLTYNLQALRNLTAENIKLRKEISKLLRTYMSLILVRCNLLSPGDCMSFPVGSEASWWTWLLSIMYPKLQGSKTPAPNNPGVPSFPAYGSAPAGGSSSGNQAAYLPWLANYMMNNNANNAQPFFPNPSLGGSVWPGFPNMNQ